MINKIIIFLLASFVSINTFALPFKNIIFFGDSLTDDGNLYKVLKMPKSPPYYKGHFSNDIIWAEHLSQYFQSQGDTKYKVFAVGGSTAVFRSPKDGALPYTLKNQVNTYLRTDYVMTDTLHAIWIGANDYLDEKKQNIEELTDEVINEIVKNTKTLIKKGAENFLILDLPDLSRMPYATALSKEEKARIQKLSELHHIKLQYIVNKLQQEFLKVKFTLVDVYSLFNDILSRPDFYNTKYNQHLSNFNTACWTGGYTLKNNRDTMSVSLSEAQKVAMAYTQGKKPCENPDTYIFWDQVHPTSGVHYILSEVVKDNLISK